MQVRRTRHCGGRVSINEQLVLRRYTHLKGYRGLEQRGEGEPFPMNAPDHGLFQTSQINPTISPLSTLGAMSSPTPTVCLMPSQHTSTNFGDLPIGWPLQDGPMITRESTHPGVGKHRPECHLGSHLSGYLTAPTQNPEEKKKTQVSLCYLILDLSFWIMCADRCRWQYEGNRRITTEITRFELYKNC